MQLCFAKVRIFLILAVLIPALSSLAQPVNDFGFSRILNVPVLNLSGNPMLYPWAGGMNSCQFSEMDLNGDNIDDLVVFDRNGNRWLTFINQGTSGQVNYIYDPQYQQRFPPVTDWMELVDYNCDGKKDIFTYGVGSIAVYKNVSTAASGIKFQFHTNQVESFQSLGYTGIYVSTVDFPAFADIDGDGDIDILTYWILGSYINYHKNLSMEKFGNCDSLDFKLDKYCWGYVKEGDTSNQMILNAPCPYKDCGAAPENEIRAESDPQSGSKHVGSTLLATDLNGDHLQDLIIGDIGYPNVVSLLNGGTADSAHMVSLDSNFPSYDIPAHLNSFLAPCSIDANFDGKKDLVLSPFESTSTRSKNTESVWYYQNTGTAQQAHFSFQTTGFLQNDMIDNGTAALPVIVDVNQDGKNDILIGGQGLYDSSWTQSGIMVSSYTSSLMLLENTGTLQTPAFTVVDSNYAGVRSLHLKNVYPAFGDLNGDQKIDMLLGCSNGTLIYFENLAAPGLPFQFAAPVNSYKNISVGANSTPQIVDLNQDGLPDLVIGNKKGLLSYYRNVGTLTNPQFQKVTDSLGKVDVRDTLVSYAGYSVPCFYKGNDGKLKLFVGSEKGGVAYYKDIETMPNGAFTLVSQFYLSVYDGERSGVAVARIDQDTMPEMIIGTISGGLEYYKGVPPSPQGLSELPTVLEFSFYPNPANSDIYLEPSAQYSGMIDYQICDITGRIVKSGRILAQVKNSIHIAELDSGVYLLSLSYNQSGKHAVKGVKKLIISR